RLSFTLRKLIPRYEPKVARLLRIVAMALSRDVPAQSRQRYFEPGRRALSRARSERDIAAVRASDPAREREAETHPAGLARPAAGGARERRERAVELGRRHANAAIDDLERDRAAVGLDGERDRRAHLRVLGGVVEQVVEGAAQQHRVAADRAIAAREAIEPAPGVARDKPARRAIDELGQRGRLAIESHVLAVEPRGDQDVV